MKRDRNSNNINAPSFIPFTHPRWFGAIQEKWLHCISSRYFDFIYGYLSPWVWCFQFVPSTLKGKFHLDATSNPYKQKKTKNKIWIMNSFVDFIKRSFSKSKKIGTIPNQNLNTKIMWFIVVIFWNCFKSRYFFHNWISPMQKGASTPILG